MYNTLRPYFILIFYFDKLMCRNTNEKTYNKKYAGKKNIFVKRFFLYTLPMGRTNCPKHLRF